MAASNSAAWWDCVVTAADGSTATLALLNGTTVQLWIVGPAVDITSGEPVAYRPVAELLSASAILTTARTAYTSGPPTKRQRPLV